jgi:hypothetical protein
MNLCLMERDGQQRRQVISATLRTPLFSPDGKWIAYAGYEKGSYTTWVSGRSRCYVVNLMNPTDIRRLGGNFPALWIDNQSLVCWDDSIISTVQTSVDGREEKRLSPDSTGVFRLRGGANVLFFDLRSATQGLYLGSPAGGESPLPQRLRLIHSFKPSWGNWGFFLSPGATFALVYNRKLEFWKISLPSGTKGPVRATFPELGPGTTVNISNDGRSIVYAGRVQTKSKLVLMGNPFE